MEAVLLAAVALGCAQAGWSLIAPGSANATGPRVDGPDSAHEQAQSLIEAAHDIRSPFAPQATDATNAAATLLSTLQLKGVRVAADPARSGAYLTLEGGERAFLVGDEIADGVMLAEVRDDRIVVSFEGGVQEIALAGAQRETASYALALMRRLPVTEEAPTGAATNGSPSVAMGALATPFSGAVALSAFGAPEQRDGRIVGWRLSGEAPAFALAAGLRAGDLVVAVNGVGADQPLALAGVAQSGAPLTLTVERAGARFTVTAPAPRT